MKFRGTVKSIDSSGKIGIDFKDIVEVKGKKIIVNLDVNENKNNNNYLLKDFQDQKFIIEGIDNLLFYQFYKERELLIFKIEKNNKEYKITNWEITND